jgi:dTDP-4-amino-4,6-dideoxygalactose transaminase
MKIEVRSPTIRRKEMDAVLTAMVADRVGPGEGARFLLQAAREYLEYDYALALRSPAMALAFALQALGLGEGDGVAISVLSPRYYRLVLQVLRLRPVYTDIAKGGPCMDAGSLAAALEPLSAEGLNCRCVLLEHSLGYSPDMAALLQAGIPVIEDISHAYGSAVEGKRAGSFGVFTILGLEQDDFLTAGGGALLYAQNRRDASVLRGLDPLPEYALPDMNAAMAAVQFREAGRSLERRREIAQAYTQAALRTRHHRFAPAENSEYNNYAFALVLESGMKDVAAYAKKKDIETAAAFARSLIQEMENPEKYPEAWSVYMRTVLFPLYPRLGSADTEKVAKLIGTLP